MKIRESRQSNEIAGSSLNRNLRDTILVGNTLTIKIGIYKLGEKGGTLMSFKNPDRLKKKKNIVKKVARKSKTTGKPNSEKKP